MGVGGPTDWGTRRGLILNSPYAPDGFVGGTLFTVLTAAV
jgi:hypothetical protein